MNSNLTHATSKLKFQRPRQKGSLNNVNGLSKKLRAARFAACYFYKIQIALGNKDCCFHCLLIRINKESIFLVSTMLYTAITVGPENEK